MHYLKKKDDVFETDEKFDKPINGEISIIRYFVYVRTWIGSYKIFHDIPRDNISDFYFISFRVSYVTSEHGR